jgi:hypothetical protein
VVEVIVYIISTPGDPGLLLTTHRDAVMKVRANHKDLDLPLEVQSWDTEASPLLALSINIGASE